MSSIYHKGELQIQKKLGETAMASRVVRMIKNTIIKGAIPFIENQNVFFVSSIDANNKLWTTMLIGSFGFINASTEGKIYFNLEHLISSRKEVFFENIKTNKEVGIIFIELGSRRRYRVNGQVAWNDQQIELTIEAGYPNCPKYIQRRVLSSLDESQSVNLEISKGIELTGFQKKWISKADTFFVGSQSKDGKPDASHRGGNPGFIEILDSGILKIPDYGGNSMYNTLGNMLENPNAGLIFIDFENGHTLQIIGEAQLLFDQDSTEDKQKTTDTGRYWFFEPKAWIQTRHHHQINWEFLDNSPFNPKDNF